MKRMVGVLKVLSDKNRLRILKLLEHRKLCVCELAAVLGITQPSVSRHLKKLKSAGLINDEQHGFWTNYFLNKTGDIYGKALMMQVRLWLNDDPVVKKDRGKIPLLNRVKLCCKTRR